MCGSIEPLIQGWKYLFTLTFFKSHNDNYRLLTRSPDLSSATLATEPKVLTYLICCLLPLQWWKETDWPIGQLQVVKNSFKCPSSSQVKRHCFIRAICMAVYLFVCLHHYHLYILTSVFNLYQPFSMYLYIYSLWCELGVTLCPFYPGEIICAYTNTHILFSHECTHWSICSLLKQPDSYPYEVPRGQ